MVRKYQRIEYILEAECVGFATVLGLGGELSNEGVSHSTNGGLRRG